MIHNICRSAVPAQKYLPERRSAAFRHHYTPDKDKDCIVKDKDQDNKDCILVLKESLRTRTNITGNLTLIDLITGSAVVNAVC